MAQLNVKIPAVLDKYYPDTDVSQIKTQMSIITRLYSGLVANISKVSNVPAELIFAFIFIESRGDANVVNKASGATGLMQVSPISATDIIIMENKAGRLVEGEKAILKRHLGTDRFNELMSLKLLGSKKLITEADLLKPELNILIGTIYMGYLMDEHEEGSTTRLDKVVTRYNQGYFSHSKGRTLTGDIKSVMGEVGNETSDYIVKLLGTNGILDILV